MKKIVALVLALVMVLGLATVASAAVTSSETKNGTTTTITAAEKYAVYAADSTNALTSATAYVVESYTAVSTKVDTTDGVALTSYIPGYYTVDNNGTKAYLYEVADAACASARIFKGDAFVTYVAEFSAPYTAWTSAAVTFVAEGEGCGTYPTDVYVNTVTYAAAEAVAGGSAASFAIMDGKFVFLSGTAASPTPHDFQKAAYDWTEASLTYKSTTDNTVVAITCEDCDKTFTVVKKIPATYKGLTYTNAQNLNGYIVLLQDVVAATPSTPAGDKVESAETFDAGIAMYVGMSVMAAAGSAVVLKKKD